MSLDLKIIIPILGIVFPIALVFLKAFNGLLKWIGHIRKKAIDKRRRRDAFDNLPEIVKLSIQNKQSITNIERLNKFLSNRIEQSGLNINTTSFLVTFFALILIGLLIGLYLVENSLMTIAIIINLVFLPFLLLNWGIEKQNQLIADQLVIGMQLFAVEFELSRNIGASLQKAAQGISNPLKRILEDCANDLAASHPPKEVFQKLANKLPGEQGRIWAQTLLMATENANTMNLIPRILTTANGYRLLQRKNIVELSSSRRVGILINMLVPLGFIGTIYILPGTKEFFITPFGRLAILLVFISVTVGILLDQLLRRVDL